MSRRPHLLAAVTVVLSIVAGMIALDLRRAHDAAWALLEPVRSLDASYDPGRWTDTVFILAIGSDERPGIEGARADALHVIGMNVATSQATIINIPRDTWVEIPGRGQGRVNEAYHFGGAQLQAETVRRLTGAPISYVFTTTFVGLAAMVDGIGGLPVDVPIAMNDPASGAHFDAGPGQFGGAQALAFSRNRSIPNGDIARTANQGQLIIHGLAAMRDRGTSRVDVIDHLDLLYRNVRVDGIGATELFRLGRAALSLEPGNVRNYTIPVRIGRVGQASVVFLQQPAGSFLFEDFVDDAVLSAH